METEKWTPLADEADLKPGQPIARTLDGKEILLVRAGHRIYACGAKCTHYGAPLNSGLIADHSITCPWHNSVFNVASGEMILPPALDHLPAYPVKIENGHIFVGSPAISPFPPLTARDPRTFVIIGAGAAGNAAAETLRRQAFAGRIIMITGEPDRPYDRPALSKDFLAGASKPQWLSLRSEKFYDQHQIELLTNSPVTAVDPDAHTVLCKSGEKIHFDRLLLATGGTPRKLDAPGTHLKNFFYLRSLADAKNILSAAQTAQKIVIIGSGLIGMEAAASLRAQNKEVHIVGRENSPLAHIFGDRVGRFFQHLHEQNGVKFLLAKTVREIVGEESVQAVVLSDGSRIDANLVIAGLGITPAVDFLKNTNLVENGAVPVDARLQTRIEGIFAAGDIALVPTAPSNKPIRSEHWVVAERQGQHAAHTMLGSPNPYREIPFFWTRQYEISLRYIGCPGEYDRIAYRGSVENGQFLAGFYAANTLTAVLAMRMDKEIIILSEMLKAGASIHPDHFEDQRIPIDQIAHVV